MTTRKTLMIMAFVASMSASAQTAREFVLDNSVGGESKLYCFLPEKPSGRAVMACPGGGYGSLSMAKEGTDWAGYFNKQGIAFFTLKYRLPKGNPELPLADAEHAMTVVRDSAKAWHINPQDVGIMGFSAGGHLAAIVSNNAPFESRPDFSILVYPVISMHEKMTHKGSLDNFLGDSKGDEKTVKLYSAEDRVNHYGTPPAIILVSNDDRTVNPVNNAIAYYSAMRKQGNKCALHVYQDGGHGWGFASWFRHHDEMLDDLTAWLDRLHAPKQGAVKVACIGNSITRGACIDMASQLGYPAMLQKKLGNGYYVRNFGLSGFTMLQKGNNPYMKTECWRMVQDFHPDIVVIKLGTNDSKPYNWQYGDEFEKDMQTMIDALKNQPQKPRIYLATPIPAFRDNLNIKEENIVNGVIPAIKKVAEKNKLEIIDMHMLFTDRAMMTADDIHPNAKGADKMAEIVAGAIR